jgi:hypothetical protein
VLGLKGRSPRVLGKTRPVPSVPCWWRWCRRCSRSVLVIGTRRLPALLLGSMKPAIRGLLVDRAELVAAEGGEDVLVEALPVASDRCGFVRVARAGAGDAALGRLDPFGYRLFEREW